MASRFSTIRDEWWQYLDPAFPLLSEDLKAVETNPILAGGLIPRDRLGTGTADGTTFLAGDGQWKPAAGTSRSVSRVLYEGGAWPARPAGASFVEWVDPTGTAPEPPAYAPASGDTWISGTGHQVAATALLPYADSELMTTNWWARTGSPTIDSDVGTITVASSADSAAQGNIAVTPGATLRGTITAASGSSGGWECWVEFQDSASGFLSALSLGTGAPGAASTQGQGTVPTNAVTASVVLRGVDGASTVFGRVTLEQVL